MLDKSLNIAVSALNSHAEAFERVAHNIAHSRTRGYSAARSGDQTNNNSGVTLNPAQAGVDNTSEASSNVDLASDIVDMISIKQGYRAALEVVRTADKMLEETLNLV